MGIIEEDWVEFTPATEALELLPGNGFTFERGQLRGLQSMGGGLWCAGTWVADVGRCLAATKTRMAGMMADERTWKMRGSEGIQPGVRRQCSRVVKAVRKAGRTRIRTSWVNMIGV